MAFKRVHRSKDKTTLAARMLADGTLDVCLETGEVFTIINGRRRKRKLQTNHKGYHWLNLYRERKDKRGKPDKYGRRRERFSAWVHRLAMMKKIAVGKCREEAKDGRVFSNWRLFIVDIDPKIDIDHDNTDRTDNRGDNLRIIEHGLHGRRSSEQWTEEDEAAVAEFNRGI